jgi:hypothetical protein
LQKIRIKESTVHVLSILHNVFSVCRSSFDLRILKTLYSTVEALTRCRKLTIAGLGRSLNRNCYVKHKIKAVDRLFGNSKLHNNLFVFYQAITDRIIGPNKNPIIIIDWSGLTPCGNFHFIRAAVPLGGRALPILEIPFPLHQYTKPKTHKHFLKCLSKMLPIDCKPIILTDAGFRNPWFKLIKSFGWDYIGRIRQNTLCSSIEEEDWKHVKTLYKKAQKTPKYLGEFLLAENNTIETYLFICKETKKNRIKINLAGKKIQCSSSLKHEKRESEPLLIATSLDPMHFNARQTIKMYKKRMQIEEGFRDLKNGKSGLSFRQNRSLSLERLSIGLLIGAIATLVFWILGIAVKEKGIHYRYQANTVKDQNVLSLFTIGWQILEEGKIRFTNLEIKQAFGLLLEAQYA